MPSAAQTTQRLHRQSACPFGGYIPHARWASEGRGISGLARCADMKTRLAFTSTANMLQGVFCSE